MTETTPTTVDDEALPPVDAVLAVTAVIALTEVVGGAVLLAQTGAPALPVLTTVSTAASTGPLVLAAVSPAWALVVVLLWTAGWRLAACLPRWRGRADTLRRVEAVGTWPVVVFVVAQLNGVSEVRTLVACYALAAAGALAPIAAARAGTSRAPLVVGAVVGIVPWGVIGFTQVARLTLGIPPTPAVQAATLLLLAAVVAVTVLEWRARTHPGSHGVDAGHAIATLAGVSVALWLVTA